MAGIGFDLRKLIQKGTLRSLLKAYGYSAVIASGPWMLSVFSIGLLTVFAPAGMETGALDVFRVTVVYVFGVSLVTTGAFQMVVTRHIADKLFIGDDKALIPNFWTSTLLIVGAQVAIGAAGAIWLDASVFYRVFTVSLYVIVSLIWHSMVFLSAARGYTAIVVSYAWGTVLSVAGGLVLGRWFGALGYLMGFTLGQALTWALLVRQIMIEFTAERALDISMVQSFRRFPHLIWIGFFYNLGIWVDKFTMWYGGPSRPVLGILRVYDPYDNAMFLAYLTMLPAFSIFLINVETDFYDAYKKFYGAISNKKGLSEIMEAHRLLGVSIDRGIGAIVKYQGIVTFLCLVFAEAIGAWTQLSPLALGMFRIGILGVFLHALFLFTMIFILYFDLRRLSIWLTAAFCVLSFGLTRLTLWAGLPTYGYGYAIACAVGFAGSYVTLGRAFNKILYLTFSSQPLSSSLPDDIPAPSKEAAPSPA